MIADAAPRLHEALPGILCLIILAAAASLVGFVRLRRWARRTVARHQPTPVIVAHSYPEEGEAP